MPAETRGVKGPHVSAPKASVKQLRAIRREARDEPDEQPADDGQGWGAPPSARPSEVTPYARAALPGTQSEHFELLFHQEKSGIDAERASCAPAPEGWDEAAERLSIVTLTPSDESWERLLEWISTYSAKESRRPWLAPIAKPVPVPACTASSAARAAPPLTGAPSPAQPAATFDLARLVRAGEFPPLQTAADAAPEAAPNAPGR